jgi:hypothetical protein
MNFRTILPFIILLVASPLATAQYIWIDDKGVKQLSDRPPPPNIPEKRILKAPGKPVFNPYESTAPTPVASEPASPKPATVAERNADFNQRRTEAAESARNAAADAQRKADQAANCDAARKNQLALDQGLRLSTFDKNGERGYMDDAQRDDLRKNTQKVLAECK